MYFQLLDCCGLYEAHPEIVSGVAREVFAQATLQHRFVEMCAEVCGRLLKDLTGDHAGLFKRALLDHCQESFAKYLGPFRTDESLDYEAQHEARVKYKSHMLGNARLCGHLLR